jgi:hypothetical protein
MRVIGLDKTHHSVDLTDRVEYEITIEQTLQRGFKHMFSEIQRSGKFYDWMTLAEEQEQELRKVCKPFYELA